MTSLATSNPSSLARLEDFLFGRVGPHFVKTGKISPEDFWLILVWKANRAKGMARYRIENRSKLSWNDAVARIVNEIASAKTDELRLKVLMSDPWCFRLPTATAILSIFYPNRFTIYDVRVCETLKEEGRGDFKRLNWPHTENTWVSYQKFMAAVKAVGENDASLRDKDHYLWGQSLLKSVKAELADAAKPPKPRKRKAVSET